MASDWIKIRKDLPTDPNVAAIAAACEISTADVVLALIVFWSWADSHSVSGTDITVGTTFIDELVRVRNFSASLADTNWLEVSNGTVSIPNFTVHLGKSAKRRATDGKRKSNGRLDEPVACPQNVRKMSACDADKKRTREEKSKKEMSTSLAHGIYDAYPRRIGKVRALSAIGKAIEVIAGRNGSMKKAAAAWLLERVQKFAESPAGQAGKFTPYPATWFNGGRFDDDAAEWQGANGDSADAGEAEYEKARHAEHEQRQLDRQEQRKTDSMNAAPAALGKLAAKVLNRKEADDDAKP